MERPVIEHLVDDTSPGGVMRVLEHVSSDPAMVRIARHRVTQVSRSDLRIPQTDASIIVSHLALNWRRLPWLIRLRGAYSDRALVHVEHSYTGGFTGLNVLQRTRFRTLLNTSLALFDRVVAVSEGQADWLLGRRHVAPENLAVIRSTVNPAPFLDLPVVAQAPRVLGLMGRLDRQKGFDIVLAALRLRPDLDVSVKVFGSGPEEQTLRRISAGDSRVRFLGWSEPLAAMASVDAVLMPSRWEAYGLVALEARAAGRPVLVTPVDGLVDHVRAGAIAVPGTAGDWAEALETLTAKTPDLHALLAARRNAAKAPERFAASWQSVIDGLGESRDRTNAA